jgi:cytochrome c-type protein NapB
MNIFKHILNFALVSGLLIGSAIADDNIATLRDASLTIEPDSPSMQNTENKDMRRERAYPMQPPTIPHKIDNYQVDLKANKCLSCHSRKQVEDSQAPMISVTHFMDRDGNFLADVSPRRYFCNQCHVPQLEAKPLVDNDFQDVDTLLRNKNK